LVGLAAGTGENAIDVTPSARHGEGIDETNPTKHLMPNLSCCTFGGKK
jgi:hypothetical protein